MEGIKYPAASGHIVECVASYIRCMQTHAVECGTCVHVTHCSPPHVESNAEQCVLCVCVKR